MSETLVQDLDFYSQFNWTDQLAKSKIKFYKLLLLNHIQKIKHVYFKLDSFLTKNMKYLVE